MFITHLSPPLVTCEITIALTPDYQENATYFFHDSGLSEEDFIVFA